MSAILNQYAGLPVIAGSGVAGLIAALTLAPRPVLLLTGGSLGAHTSSALAQGGMAAAVGPDDSARLHAADTLAAGDGLCNADVVEGIVGIADRVVETLERFGVVFDRNRDGALCLGLEAAHSRHRILHAEGDGSGEAITSALVKAVLSTPSITVLEHVWVSELQTHDGAISGVVCTRNQDVVVIPTSQLLLATGGVGGLYEATTNPVGNFGHGIALAARAGAVLSDMEFVQFHPTALRTARRPLALVSEAVRGEGAVLVDDRGHPIMAGVHGADLAPRDIVARAVAAEIKRGGSVHLDARDALGSKFRQRFPTVNRLCLEAGIDPSRQLIPVMPAAHYHMGGIDVDRHGRSSVEGLWAAGEVTSTGLHGANRLASNSLLEAAVMGIRAAEDMGAVIPVCRPTPPIFSTRQLPATNIAPVRTIVSAHLGVLRDGRGLRTALSALLPLIDPSQSTAQPATVALLMAVFAVQRAETRGAHARTDFPQRAKQAQRQRMTLTDAVETARLLTSEPALRSA
jgi:L-aspartate oxidase